MIVLSVPSAHEFSNITHQARGAIPDHRTSVSPVHRTIQPLALCQKVHSQILLRRAFCRAGVRRLQPGHSLTTKADPHTIPTQFPSEWVECTSHDFQSLASRRSLRKPDPPCKPERRSGEQIRQPTGPLATCGGRGDRLLPVSRTVLSRPYACVCCLKSPQNPHTPPNECRGHEPLQHRRCGRPCDQGPRKPMPPGRTPAALISFLQTSSASFPPSVLFPRPRFVR